MILMILCPEGMVHGGSVVITILFSGFSRASELMISMEGMKGGSWGIRSIEVTMLQDVVFSPNHCRVAGVLCDIQVQYNHQRFLFVCFFSWVPVWG